MSASVFLPAGRQDQESGGEMFWPSHVYSAGIMPPSSKAVLVSLRVILSSPFVPFSIPVVAAVVGVTFESAGGVALRWHAASSNVHESRSEERRVGKECRS